jgi:hypothetical protein
MLAQVPADAPRTITIDDDIIWTDEYLADGLHRTGNGERTTTKDLQYKWTNPSEIRNREVVARTGGGSDTTTLSIAAGKLGLEVNDLTTVTENLENFGDIITKSYTRGQPDEQIITPGWEVDYDFRTTGKLTETTTSVGSGLQTGELKRRVERSTPLVGGGWSEHTDTWQRVPVWNTTDTTIVEGTASGGDKLEHRIGGKFGELVWLGTEGEHFYDEQVQDSYVNGLANELRVGNYRTLPVALESRAGRDDGIFAGKLTPLAGAGLVWSETERSGAVFSEYDSDGNLLAAEGLFTHQIESGGDAAAEDYEQATRTFGDWNSQREFERTSNDHFRSFRTRTWTPSVSGEGTVDYQSTDAAFEQKFWGSFGESDTRSVQQGSNWRVPETTLTRSGQYGSGAANPLTRSKSAGDAFDSGFYDGGFASWGYEGQAIHTRFDSAIGPGSPQSPSTWDDSNRPDMGSGPKPIDQVNQTVGVMVSVPADIEKRAGELYSYVGYRTQGHYASWYATAAYSFLNPTLAFTTEAGAAFWSGVFRTGKDVSPEFYAVSNGITRVSGAALAFVTLPASAAASWVYAGVVGLWGADQAITGGLEMATGQDRHTVGGQALSHVVGETAGNLVYDFGIPTPAALRSIAGALRNLLRNPSKLVDESINFVDDLAGTNAPNTGLRGTVFSQNVRSYIDAIERHTGFRLHSSQRTRLADNLRTNSYSRLSTEAGEAHRRLFTQRVKNAQIAEWERQTGQTWPRYAEDVLNAKGKVIAKKGQPYDAHHVIENIYGGPHEWWNLTPARFPDQHQGGLHLDTIMDTLFP